MAQITYTDFVGGETTKLTTAMNEIKTVVNANDGGGSGISAVNVQENAVLVGAEDTLNFEDGTNFNFTVTTDGVVVKIRGDATTTATVWRDGVGAPSNSLGIDGDYYLNRTTGTGKGDVYKKSAGVYAVVGNISVTGDTGATGAAGTPGTVIRDGAGVPDNTVGIDGDYYINTSTADLYEKAAGVYGIVGNLAYSHTHTANQISDSTVAGRAILTAADAPAQRTALGLVIDTDIQSYSAKTAAIAALTWAADKLIYLTGAAAAATADLTAFARSILAAVDAAAVKTLLALVKADVGLGNVDNTSDATKNSAAATLTNKTLYSGTNAVAEMTGTADTAAPAPTGGSTRNIYDLSALTQAATFAAPGGTPLNGNMLVIRIRSAAAQNLVWNAIYVSHGPALPATTVAGKTMNLVFMYSTMNSLNSWCLLSNAQEP